jgi:hypothetical protein
MLQGMLTTHEPPTDTGIDRADIMVHAMQSEVDPADHPIVYL